MCNRPEVTIVGVFDMQVCVPKNFTNKQVIEFAESNNPSGTKNGWQIRKEGNPDLAGYSERTTCDEREGFVHIMLDT